MNEQTGHERDERTERTNRQIVPIGDAIGRRRFLAAAGLAGAGVTTGTVAGTTAPPTVTVSPTETAIEPGDTTTVEIGLTEAPNGLAGFHLEVGVDTDVATVVDGELGETFADAVGTTVETAEGTATLRAVKAVDAGTTGVDVGTVEIEGVDDGETTIEVAESDALPIEDADGDLVEPTIDAATLTVGDGESTDGEPTDGGSGSDDSGADDTASEDGNPGFGPLTAAAGVASGVAYSLRRRDDRADTGAETESAD